MSRVSGTVVILAGLVLAAEAWSLNSAPLDKEAPQSTAGPERRWDELARKLVNDCAQVREGDLVQIAGNVRDLRLLEDLTLHTWKVGGHPLLLPTSDRLDGRYFSEVPARFDARSPEWQRKLAEFVTVQIAVESEDPEVIKGIAPERLAAVHKANEGVARRWLERKVRSVSIGNGLYPSDFEAKRSGITRAELTDIFWAALDVDYKALSARADKVREMLERGGEVHVTTPTGTDLRFRLQGKVHVNAGTFEKDGAHNLFLPAGEVYSFPKLATAEGKLVMDKELFRGHEVEGVTMTFAGGKLQDITARKGLEHVRADYDNGGAGRDELAYLDIGINPHVPWAAHPKLFSWIGAGLVTIGVGNNVWAGGDNHSAFGPHCPLRHATLKVDGKILVEKGILKVQ